MRQVLHVSEEGLELGEVIEGGWALFNIDMILLDFNNQHFYFQNALPEYIEEAGYALDELYDAADAANAEGEHVYPVYQEELLQHLIDKKRRTEEEGLRQCLREKVLPIVTARALQRFL